MDQSLTRGFRNDATTEVHKKKEEQKKMQSVYSELRRSQRVEGWQSMERKREHEQDMKKLEAREQNALELEFRQWKRKKDRTWGTQDMGQTLENKRREEEKHKRTVVDPSYERLQAEVKKYDDGLVGGWKEDIDTLLVFAGLFSAVVTAFLIESYQWLSEDAAVVALTQISRQLNGTQNQSVPFAPEASSIRINCFWFLSLIFSLTSALFGLLCKQWLREHQRDVPTRTLEEGLALRQLRRDSFEKWGVASFLSALPILLQVAVVLFFVGLLDLLWSLQPVLFGICFTAISISVGLYVLTTILPTITIPRDQSLIQTWSPEPRHHVHDFGQLAYQFICPYKSPQAWAVYKLFTRLPKPLLRNPFLGTFTRTYFRPLWDHVQAQPSSWSTFDLRVLRQFDQQVQLGFDSFRLRVYELRALQWAVTMFCDSPSMVPHLKNVIETLPPSVAISAVLDRWDDVMWEPSDWHNNIGAYLEHRDVSFDGPKPITSDSPLLSREGIELLFRQEVWDVCSGRLPDLGSLEYLLKELKYFPQIAPKLSRNLRFHLPLSLASTLWSHKDPRVRQQSLRPLQHYEEAWKPSPSYDEERHNRERVAFANGLSMHIVYSRQPSVLLTSKRGQGFVRFINNEVLIHRLYLQHMFRDWDWRDAIEKVQKIGRLSPGYFARVPGRRREPPRPELLPQLEPIRYSIDTIRSQSTNLYNENEETPTPSIGNVQERIDIQVHGSRGNTTNRILNLADGILVPGSADEGKDVSSPAGEDLPGPSTSYILGQNISAEGRSPNDEECAASEAMDAVPSADRQQPLHHLSSPGHRDREADNLGTVGSLGRVGWDPTNDPYALRVRWFC